MDRYTRRDYSTGEAYTGDAYLKPINGVVYGDAIERLALYEDTCLLPGEVSDLMTANGEKEGCKYCSGDTSIPLETDVGKAWIKGDELQNCYGTCKIKFCPMCGRKLKGGEKHE